MTGATAPARRTRRRSLLLVAALTVATVGAAGVLAGVVWLRFQPHIPGVTTALTVRGGLTISGTSVSYSGGSCAGRGGYSDIHAGVQVVVTDEAQKVVGVGSLGSGESAGMGCRFPFEVTGIPRGREFYGVTVGRRGTMQYTQDRFDQSIELSLG